MDKHLTEIELFEYANQLIEDKLLLSRIEKHLSSCNGCKESLDITNSIDVSLKENLAVNHTVDLNENIIRHFTQEKSFFFKIDVKSIIYVFLVFFGLIFLNQLSSNLTGFSFSYLTPIFSAITGLFFVELLITYVKYKNS